MAQAGDGLPPHPHPPVDPGNGFCSDTRTYHSLRPPVPLPPVTHPHPLSVTDYALSLLPSSVSSSPDHRYYIIDVASDQRLIFSRTLRLANSLSLHLRDRLSKGDVAFILLPPSFNVPIIYLSLLSLGVVVSPSNPLSSASEIAHQVRISNPSIAFATSSTSSKLPPNYKLRLGVVLVDSPEFESVVLTNAEDDSSSASASPTSSPSSSSSLPLPLMSNVNGVHQSDPATILYSSGTTGRVKGVLMTHRNLISMIAGRYHARHAAAEQQTPRAVCLFSLPPFHVYGFFVLIMNFVLGETLIWLQKFEFEAMLKAVEKYRVTLLPVSPPIVVNMMKSKLTDKYDLRSLQTALCGGAPLGREVSEQFQAKFPHVELLQGYAMTESGAGSGMMGPEESRRYGSVGRLSATMEAKIVDPGTGVALPPGQKGELWLRGPCVMKGYVGDDKATAETIDSDGWLKTGDLCYFDNEGFLFVVDRLKELIKYKAYQVPPAELEHLLQSHPEIADAAVIPYPDEEAGQIPMAFVVRKPGSSITESQAIEFIAKQVAPYKKVRRVAFIDSIPKSPAGKISRRDLIKIAMSCSKARL
ncbi:4-coumarate--CoA ligase-like 9 isoform X2 [Punica granatum]|uniref:4-coumarate--CoA ligase-like 9 isoform X2 n=2 Tax=Punica granatum TaxID=22663 RepID=A0A6P8BS29_PUNGR|nr:4-coumarate--CoA ligase-like 9 isoform X2 [Punica granatum]